MKRYVIDYDGKTILEFESVEDSIKAGYGQDRTFRKHPEENPRLILIEGVYFYQSLFHGFMPMELILCSRSSPARKKSNPTC